jgi:hypothetical protein
MSLPNRKERRKIAKNLGLFGKNKSANTEDAKDRAKSMGNLIRLRNLTEQRNKNKEQD